MFFNVFYIIVYSNTFFCFYKRVEIINDLIIITQLIYHNTNRLKAMNKINTNIPNKNITLNDVERWRLLLGEASQASLGAGMGSDADTIMQMDAALSWLYGRDKEGTQEQLDRQAGDAPSSLNTPEWINQIQQLFPQSTIERLEKDALEIYQLDDLVTSPEVLEKATPNPTLLAAVLRTKHLMNPDVLMMARKLVQAVVADMMAKLQQEIVQSFSGVRKPIAFKKTGSFSQFALKETLKRNLKFYQPECKKLLLEQPWFYINQRSNPKKWQIILVVDQSGSMVSSVIHAAITAACFWNLPNMKTHLLAFDTSVVDLTQDTQDPVELLMQVQLGGGTDIAHAMQYASDLITDAKRSIVVLITDFYEGGNEHQLIHTTQSLTTQGTKVLGLAALDENAQPDYCKETAKKMVNVGAHVAAMTPGELAIWLASVIG